MVDVRATWVELEELPERAPLSVVALNVGTVITPVPGLNVRVVAVLRLAAVPPLATFVNKG